jgi:hypothetical protein
MLLLSRPDDVPVPICEANFSFAETAAEDLSIDGTVPAHDGFADDRMGQPARQRTPRCAGQSQYDPRQSDEPGEYRGCRYPTITAHHCGPAFPGGRAGGGSMGGAK